MLDEAYTGSASAKFYFFQRPESKPALYNVQFHCKAEGISDGWIYGCTPENCLVIITF